MTTKRSSWMSKVMVFVLALAVVFTYSVMPMSQAYAAAKSKKPAKVTGVKATAVSSSSVKLTWKKAKNAKKYQIYVSTKSKKGYKRVATVKSSKRSYTVKKYNKKALKANKKYYFKVRAVNGKKYGKFSKAVSKKTLKKENIVEKPITEGEAKARTMTIEIDMTDAARYPQGKKVEVWVPVPCGDDCEPYQVVKNFEVTADKAAVKEFTVEKKSGWSNQMAHIVWDENTDPADRKAVVKFDAERKAVSRPDPKEDASATIPADAQKYITLESSAIDLDNAYVQKYAKIAAGDATTTLGKAENIYNWVIANLERFDIGDKFTGKDGKEVEFFNATGCGEGNPGNLLERFDKYGRWGGHCTDLNSCFVALCRANGIAAREMFGIRLNDTSSDGQHCWAEFYLPGEGWTPADPGDVLKQARSVAADRSKEAIEAARKDQSVLDKKKALWCGVDNNRIVLSRGRDLVLEPAQQGEKSRNTFGYPYAEMGDEHKCYNKEGKLVDIDCTKYKDFKYTITCTEVGAVDFSKMDKDSEEWASYGIKYEDLDYAKDYVIDVRPADTEETQYYGAGHIVGSTSFPVPADYSKVDKEGLKAEYDKAKGNRVVIVCVKGKTLAGNAMQALQESGADMSKVTYLIGGATGFTAEDGVNNAYKLNLGVKEDAVAVGEDVIVDLRNNDNFDTGHFAGSLRANVQGGMDDSVKAALDDAYKAIPDGKKLVLVCIKGHGLAKQAVAYYQSAGVDMTKITYLIGGATGVSDTIKADTTKWEVSEAVPAEAPEVVPAEAPEVVPAEAPEAVPAE